MATQPGRQTKLKLSLGSEQQIELVRLEAFEALSQPFTISIDVLSTIGEVALLEHLGKPALVESLLDGEHQRYFHGVIVAGRFLEENASGGFLYRLTLAPSAYFHEQGRNFRIFQDMAILDIVKKVLDDCKIAFDVKATKTTPTRTYCVQYGESDFAFVSRLLEEFGLYYFYAHQESAHTLVICDDKGNHQPLPAPKLTFNPLAESGGNIDSQNRDFSTVGHYVTAWHEHVTSGAEAKVMLRDFDFTQPAAPRESKANEDHKHAGEQVEVFSWPGRYYKDNEGDQLSAVLLDARRAQRLRYEGTSAFTGIQPGFTCALAHKTIDRFDGKSFLIIDVRTTLSTEQYSSGGAAEATQVEFGAIPDDVQFRAPIVTPRPVARGPETAVVTGPSGEEIFTDKYGRVKVHFHWDRLNPYNETSSCWLRVSQTGGLGNTILPRIGHEVLVDFINGNPDRPMVVGRVFNPDHMPAYDLPGDMTRAVWRSKTHKQTTGSTWPEAKDFDMKAQAANEISLEDKTGNEELFIQAEKDLKVRARNDETHKIGRDATVEIGRDRTETVYRNETITIQENRTETVNKDETVTVEGDRKVEVHKTDTLTVTQKLKIESYKEIEIVVGASSIKLTPTAIEVKSVQIDVKGDAQVQVSSPLTTVKGDGNLTLKGGTVMIN